MLRLKQPALQVDNAPGLSATEWRAFWLQMEDGRCTVGSGVPGQGVFLTWKDEAPRADLVHVGLSTWDKHVCFRQVSVLQGAQWAQPAFKAHSQVRCVPLELRAAW